MRKYWKTYERRFISKFVMQNIFNCIYFTYTSNLSIYFFIRSTGDILRFSLIVNVSTFFFRTFFISEIELTKFSHSKGCFKFVIINSTTINTEYCKTCLNRSLKCNMNSKCLLFIFLRFFFFNEYLCDVAILT